MERAWIEEGGQVQVGTASVGPLSPAGTVSRRGRKVASRHGEGGVTRGVRVVGGRLVGGVTGEEGKGLKNHPSFR